MRLENFDQGLDFTTHSTWFIFFVDRNVSLGVNTLWARIGGMAAPQIFLLVS